jgi:hypothetical protein
MCGRIAHTAPRCRQRRPAVQRRRPVAALTCDCSNPNHSPARLLIMPSKCSWSTTYLSDGDESRGFLIPFYLVDAPVQGRTFTFPDGEKLQLMGGQFVAFGPHKDTGQPYEWENWESEWPRITTAQLQQYILSEVPVTRWYVAAFFRRS